MQWMRVMTRAAKPLVEAAARGKKVLLQLPCEVTFPPKTIETWFPVKWKVMGL